MSKGNGPISGPQLDPSRELWSPSLFRIPRQPLKLLFSRPHGRLLVMSWPPTAHYIGMGYTAKMQVEKHPIRNPSITQDSQSQLCSWGKEVKITLASPLLLVIWTTPCSRDAVTEPFNCSLRIPETPYSARYHPKVLGLLALGASFPV